MIFEKRFDVDDPRGCSMGCSVLYEYDTVEDDHSLTIWGSHGDVDMTCFGDEPEQVLQALERYQDVMTSTCPHCGEVLGRQRTDLADLRTWLKSKRSR
jgi:hypothetical protein